MNPASGTVTLFNGSTSPVTISAGARVATPSNGTGNAITFETTADVTIAAASGSVLGSANVAVSQGVTTTGESLGVSDGTAYQSFKISNPGVFTNDTMTVTVNGVTYTKVYYTIDSGPQDKVYSLYTDADGYCYVQFGDGVSGVIPPSGSTVLVNYRYSDTPGSFANVLANSVTAVISDKYGLPLDNLQVNNSTSFSGGSDIESTDSIRINAPLSLRSLNRAVSMKDYAQLAVQVPGIAKAIAVAASYTSVNLFIAPSYGFIPSSSTLKTNVINYFADKTPPNTSLNVFDYTPAYPYLDVTVQVLPQYDKNFVKSSVFDAITTLFSFDNVIFNDNITQGDVYAACSAVDGVAYITITDFEKLYSLTATAATGVSDFSCNVDEIPIYNPAFITITTNGGVN
jgi:predicted phage baseplate assembly protein